MSDKEDGQEATEHSKLSRLIVEKMHGPKDFHDKQIHTNIPKEILTNILILTAGENGLRKLTEGDVTVFHEKENKVTIMREDESGELIPYRTITRTAWKENRFWADFWSGVSGNLMEELMSVPVTSGEGGWRSEQAVKEVSALTNSERMLLEAGNQNKPGVLKRLIGKVKQMT